MNTPDYFVRYYLSGPTASGKTAIGLILADRLDAEIVSMDSMSLYIGMDIGTAKPTVQEQERVPHHLLDVIAPSQEYSLSQYLHEVERVVTEIRSRGKNVLFVGGTPLYLKGLLRGIFHGPGSDARIRERLQCEADSGENLHRRLTEVDPDSARRLHHNDVRRIIRALEVYEMTGQAISAMQTQFDVPASTQTHRVVVLDWEKERLNERINERVTIMFEQGFLEETRALFERNLSKTASQAVGYRELFDYFQGKYAYLSEAQELIRLHTRQFSKKQRTWFRGLSECRFYPMCPTSDPNKLAEELFAHFCDENFWSEGAAR